MLERIQGLPDNVLGFVAKGEVTGADYESVLIPAVEELLARQKSIRFLYHLGEEFTGFDAKAMWDDARVDCSTSLLGSVSLWFPMLGGSEQP